MEDNLEGTSLANLVTENRTNKIKRPIKGVHCLFVFPETTNTYLIIYMNVKCLKLKIHQYRGVFEDKLLSYFKEVEEEGRRRGGGVFKNQLKLKTIYQLTSVAKKNV